MIKPHTARRPKTISTTRRPKRSTIPQKPKVPTAPKRPKINPTRKRIWTPTGINIYQEVYKMTDEKLKAHIAETSLKSYGQCAKDLQVDAVFNLVQGRNTFLLAGTGFGKSRCGKPILNLRAQQDYISHRNHRLKTPQEFPRPSNKSNNPVIHTIAPPHG
ncbi:ATP-dependent DNA helicase sgs1 [Puccinia graminis f. sp. tritici]|uniref:ATP-dependent DNA helicase sgs1 n=1 Tax=Puccinia graminis f. sp. tritici TaxID=56615 RepID=A0A5B0LLP0_PUCGR|nr:ATP-dependent DNA helicase sgs1 [Puccinia graminis f. sp. tritici]